MAFDGNMDNRAIINYGFTGKKNGVSISFDWGFNDYLSGTSRFYFINTDNGDFINANNLSLGLKFHFIEVLNYGELNDLYAGIDIGYSTSGLHIGYLRQITRSLGVQI